MRNLLNILLIISLFVWILGGVLLPIMQLIDLYFYDISEYKELVLSSMLYSFAVTSPIGLYNIITGGSANITLPNNNNKTVEGKKPGGCSTCKKKK